MYPHWIILWHLNKITSKCQIQIQILPQTNLHSNPMDVSLVNPVEIFPFYPFLMMIHSWWWSIPDDDPFPDSQVIHSQVIHSYMMIHSHKEILTCEDPFPNEVYLSSFHPNQTTSVSAEQRLRVIRCHSSRCCLQGFWLTRVFHSLLPPAGISEPSYAQFAQHIPPLCALHHSQWDQVWRYIFIYTCVWLT